MEIGDRIKALRELRGMTQTELALAMGYKDKSTICKIEANQRDLPRSKAARAAEVLGVEPGYLVGWEADQKEFDLQLLAIPAETEQLKYLLSIARNLKDDDLQRLIVIAEALAVGGGYHSES